MLVVPLMTNELKPGWVLLALLRSLKSTCKTVVGGGGACPALYPIPSGPLCHGGLATNAGLVQLVPRLPLAGINTCAPSPNSMRFVPLLLVEIPKETSSYWGGNSGENALTTVSP